MSPQARRQQAPATPTPATPDTQGDTPQAITLKPGEHNPYLEGLLAQGENIANAIKGWMLQRDHVRQASRLAVESGLASKEQKKRVAEMYPMPKRTKKSEENGETPASS